MGMNVVKYYSSLQQSQNPKLFHIKYLQLSHVNI